MTFFLTRTLVLYTLFNLSNLYAKQSKLPFPSYYPQDLQQKIINKKVSDKSLLDELFMTLSMAHVYKRGSADTLVPSCRKKRKCFKERINFSYKMARKMLFGLLHLKKDKGGYYIKDKYCEKKFTQFYGVGPGKIPNHHFINCEHTWPQSRFTKKFSIHSQLVDLHHLFPVESRANSTRNNTTFADVNAPPISKICSKSKRGPSTEMGITSFEPPASHKGNVARAIFYFSTRYRITISDHEEFYLRRWHTEDPVDAEEILRNQKIFEIQRNRNPYIDMPFLVELINDF